MFLPCLKFQFPLTLSEIPTKPIDSIFQFHVPLSKKFNDRILTVEHYTHWPAIGALIVGPYA